MNLNRRRFLTIAAAGVLLPRAASGDMFHRRTGRALGAPTSLQLVNTSAAKAETTFTAVEAELARLERIFSLYDSTSELSTLNSNGMLENPAPELLEVLSLCESLHDATDGAFDPTIQPLWAHHAGLDRIDNARDLIGWSNVEIGSTRVSFAKPGVQLTLNGVAQGYITDRIAALLRAHGLRQVMIDTGEIAAVGQNADNLPWVAGITDPKGKILARVRLTDRALATSATDGMLLDPKLHIGHILHPQKTDGPVNRVVAVSSTSAAVADGLSTAGCLLTKPGLVTAISHFTATQLEIFV